MKNNSLGQKILGQIKENNISPKPKWQFLFKNYVVWGVGALALILGGMTFSVIIYLQKFSDWNIYQQMGNSFAGSIFLMLPYFWLLSLALFIIIIYYNIKHTKKGYRYSLPMILLFSLMSSAILGVVFFRVGLGQEIDDVLGEHAPLYSKVINHQLDFWSQPDRGRLVGVVVSKIDNDHFSVVDLGRNTWVVSVQNNPLFSSDDIQLGRPIRLLGETSSKTEFIANMIMPLGPGRGAFMRSKQHLPPELREKMMRDHNDCPRMSGQNCYDSRDF